MVMDGLAAFICKACLMLQIFWDIYDIMKMKVAESF